MEQTELVALLAKLRQEHGEIDPFYANDQLIVLARPKVPAEWDRYQNALSSMAAAAASGSGVEVDTAGPQRLFILACVVYPSRDDVNTLLHKYPATAGELGKRAGALVRAKITDLKNV